MELRTESANAEGVTVLVLVLLTSLCLPAVADPPPVISPPYSHVDWRFKPGVNGVESTGPLNSNSATNKPLR